MDSPLSLGMMGSMDNIEHSAGNGDDRPVSADQPRDSDPQSASAQNTAPQTASDKVREMERDSLFMQGVLHLPGQSQPVTVRVRNLSAGGLMADYAGEIAQDTFVEIELRNIGRVSGRVAWVSASQFGLAFDAKIDPLAVRRPIGVKRDDLFRPLVVDRYLGPKRTL